MLNIQIQLKGVNLTANMHRNKPQNEKKLAANKNYMLTHKTG